MKKINFNTMEQMSGGLVCIDPSDGHANTFLCPGTGICTGMAMAFINSGGIAFADSGGFCL